MKIKLYYFILICVLLCLLKGHLFQSPMHSIYSTLAAALAPRPEELSCYTECNQGNLMFSITGSGGDRVVEKVHNVCVSEWVGKRKKSSEQQNSLLHMRSKKKWSLCPHKPGLQPMQTEKKPQMEVHPAAGFNVLVGTLQICDYKHSPENMTTSSLTSTGTCSCMPQNRTLLTKLPVNHKECRFSFF